MAEVKDPAIKLFGKTIQLPLNDDVSHDRSISRSDDKKIAAMDSKQEEGSSSTTLVDSDKDEAKPNQKEEQSETTTSSQEKTLKKPDKILPCPRCNSMDTKFCYFNNYNVNQPRHFCKNCQRYWTAGGTMRNVPVGAGRRKNKNSSSLQHRHIVVPDPASGIIYPSIRASGSVLCDSMASALNIAEKSPNSSEMAKREPAMNGFHGLTPQLPCFPAPPWAPAWSPAQWGGSVAAPPFVPSGYPVSMYAAPAPPYWNMAWLPRPSVSTDHSSTSSSPNSPLGKHSRERDELGDETRPETKVLVPKTLRIDDPNEAAKSSIWATLGIKNEKADSINSGGVFRGFQSKDGETGSPADTSMVLQANPAALSRSLTFRESAE